MVQLARVFKRSWVEMAEALNQVKSSRIYEEWGYDDVYLYCSNELQLKKSTVEKLTGSYQALTEHAPNVLSRDGIAQQIPTCDSVDYFAKALRGDAANDARGGAPDGPDDEVIAELHHAVFEEQTPVAALRRRFNPILHPKPEGAEKLENLEKTRNGTRRLQKLLEGAEGVSAERIAEVNDALESLDADLEDLIEAARGELDAARDERLAS